MSISSEELDKQVADFIAGGGSVRTLSPKNSMMKTFARFEQGEFNQVVEFIKCSAAPVLLTEIALYFDFSKTKVKAILDSAMSKDILCFEICPRHKVKRWRMVK